jgi:hypothetical protein
LLTPEWGSLQFNAWEDINFENYSPVIYSLRSAYDVPQVPFQTRAVPGDDSPVRGQAVNTQASKNRGLSLSALVETYDITASTKLVNVELMDLGVRVHKTRATTVLPTDENIALFYVSFTSCSATPHLARFTNSGAFLSRPIALQLIAEHVCFLLKTQHSFCA